MILNSFSSIITICLHSIEVLVIKLDFTISGKNILYFLHENLIVQKCLYINNNNINKNNNEYL